MILKLCRKDVEGSDPILLGIGKHALGRGIPLECKDKRISRQHCQLEVGEDGVTKITAMHINPCFYYSQSTENFLVLKKGENATLSNGDSIALLPDSYKYSISLVEDDKDNRKDHSESPNTEVYENSIEEMNETQNVSACNKSTSELNCSTVLANDLSDDGIAFGGDDDLAEENTESNVASPSLLEGASPSTLQIDPKSREECNDEEDNSSPKAKRPRPNSPTSPQDIKPDLAELQANMNVEPATSSVKIEPADVKDGKVKDEPKDSSKPNESPSGSNDNTASTSNRTKCSFGASCYRKNPQHTAEYCHPGDPEWAAPVACQWGASCYRLNAQHRASYTHPGPPAPRPPQPQLQPGAIPRTMRVERNGNIFNITAHAVNFYDDHFEVDDFDGDSVDYDYEF